MNKIPFVNLDRQYASMRVEIDDAIQAVIDRKAFIQGPFVEAFERSFAAFSQCKHAIGCSNGTAAISLALEALSVGRGDEVITPSHTFAASANAICNVGAVPVFVDIEPEAYTLDVAAVARAITSRTKAILPVHIYGTPCDMVGLKRMAEERGVAIVEDAAQAHGALIGQTPVGGLSAATTFSFYPGKNLGAYGDAGAVITNDDALALRLRKLRDHGRTSKYLHDSIGYNHRMDGIQGAILSAKLKHLAKWNDRRRAIANRYDGALQQRGFKTIKPAADATPVYHLYVVEVANRDEVQSFLRANGVETGVHYPVPLHRQQSFAAQCAGQSFPVTERIVERIVSLPICGDLADDEQNHVIDCFLRVARA
jgi:dTDP-4-amino-4,6-dideoxygalactose transaminase